jgi:hypothetical protein
MVQWRSLAHVTEFDHVTTARIAQSLPSGLDSLIGLGAIFYQGIRVFRIGTTQGCRDKGEGFLVEDEGPNQNEATAISPNDAMQPSTPRPFDGFPSRPAPHKAF